MCGCCGSLDPSKTRGPPERQSPRASARWPEAYNRMRCRRRRARRREHCWPYRGVGRCQPFSRSQSPFASQYKCPCSALHSARFDTKWNRKNTLGLRRTKNARVVSKALQAHRHRAVCLCACVSALSTGVSVSVKPPFAPSYFVASIRNSSGLTTSDPSPLW